MDIALQQFADAVGSTPHLDHAALLIDQWEHPEQSIAPYLTQLDEIAKLTQTTMERGPADPVHRAKAISATLFGELGFHGNQNDYYDPRNSFLASVLERKVGLPITLGVLYLEIARRVGVLAQGVNFPGHFIVRVAVDDAWLFIDAFDQGKALSPTDLDGLAKRSQPLDGRDALYLRSRQYVG